ncbi:hypothetical protein [Vibrio owensii]|uniref:hypothetical protein n=1 Tax=Vibrio harveyi group TaxID=717610 RepID=UPI003CC6CF52
MLEHEDLDAEFTGKTTRVSMTVQPAEIVGRRKENAAKSNSSKSSGRASNVPSASEAGKRLAVREAKRKAAKIKKFSNVVSEISPLISVSSKGVSTKEDFERTLVGYYQAQSGLKAHVLSSLKIGELDPQSRQVAHLLGSRISELVAKGDLNNLAKEKIDILATIMSECNSTSPVLQEMMTEQIVSSDVLVNIKSTIFPYALVLEKVLSSMGATDLVKNSHLRWFHTLAIYLTKDVAFNWDKDSGFREREILFENMLKHSCEIVMDTWKSFIVDSLVNEYVVLDKHLLFEKLTSFSDLLEKRDMGYKNHPELNMEWLEGKISEFAFVYLSNQKINELNDRENGIYLCNLLKVFDDLLCDSWIELSDRIASEVKAMSNEDKANWIKTVGSKPMSLNLVFELLDKKIAESPSLIESIELNHSQLEKDAKTRLAMLWGMSNAICKTKKKS